MAMSQLPLSLEIPKQPDIYDFFISEANELAISWLNQWPDWPRPYNALNIYGPKGCGKSQLGALFAGKKPSLRLLSLTDFDRHDYEDVSLFVLDDVSNTPQWSPEALFHLINYLAETGKSALLLSHEPLAQVNWHLADLESRMRTLPSQAVYLPDDELLGALLDKYFQNRQCHVAPEVLRYILTRIERSYEAASQMAYLIDKASLAAKKPVTIALVREIFENQLALEF
ncbi:MAG: HdaA/DnaA family protein [Candidatus Puniceispirillaceae bacterium]